MLSSHPASQRRRVHRRSVSSVTAKHTLHQVQQTTTSLTPVASLNANSLKSRRILLVTLTLPVNLEIGEEPVPIELSPKQRLNPIPLFHAPYEADPFIDKTVSLTSSSPSTSFLPTPISKPNYRIVPYQGHNTMIHEALKLLPDDFHSGEKLFIGQLAAMITNNNALYQSILTVKEDLNLQLKKESCIPVMATESSLSWSHYSLYCKQVLWPLMHSILPASPALSLHTREYFSFYKAMNEEYCKTIAAIYQTGDLILIHDYHLMLLPALLRNALGNDAVIGFYLHSPFPSSEIFRCLPERKEILESLLEATLLGCQTYGYARHWLSTTSRLLGVETTPRGIQTNKKLVPLMICPMSLVVQNYTLSQLKKETQLQEMIQFLQSKYKGKSLIVGMDTLDVVQGVKQKLLAYERFLELNIHREQQLEVVFIQIVTLPTVETQQSQLLARQISEVVARIQHRFGRLNYEPLVYLQQELNHLHQLALLSVANVCLITSLRDGMNQLAHEFVLCQQQQNNPGVLLLSEFTGASSILTAAVRINPWDTLQVANQLMNAMRMTENERQQRQLELVNQVMRCDATQSMQKWLYSMLSSSPSKNAISLTKVPEFEFCPKEWKQDPFVFLLVTDKPISFYQANHNIAVLSEKPKDCFDSVSFDGWIFAEHGLYCKSSNSCWQPLFDQEKLVQWHEPALPLLEFYLERTPETELLFHGSCLCCNFTLADKEYGQWQAMELVSQLSEFIIPFYPVHVSLEKRKVYLRPSVWGHTSRLAVLHWLKERFERLVIVTDQWYDEWKSDEGIEAIIWVGNENIPNGVDFYVNDWHNLKRVIDSAQT